MLGPAGLGSAGRPSQAPPNEDYSSDGDIAMTGARLRYPRIASRRSAAFCNLRRMEADPRQIEEVEAARARRNRMIGIALMCGAVISFSFLDAIAKYLNAYMDTLQVVWARYTGGFLLTLLIFNPVSRPGMMRTGRPILQVVRALLLVCSTISNFLAFRYLQLDQALSILFSTPFLVAILAGPMLGEWIGWRRWVAILVGFSGVLLVTRPGIGGVHWAAIYSMASAIFYSFYIVATRVLSRSDRTDTTLFYSNLVGALAITLSLMVPMMPGMAHHMEMMKPGPEIAPGWSYNPSTWHQRAPMIGLGFLGWLVSRYLAAYQLRHIPTAWDPFFGDGTIRVLDSEVSKAWPISDAGLGSLSYMIEALSGFMGDRVRWRTMPWMVLMFFFLVVPLGVTSIVLVVMQPVMVGAWCTICLVTAVAMLIMIPLTLDEVIAMTPFMLAARRQGKPLWRIFWMGGTIETEPDDRRTPAFDAPFTDRLRAMWWGVNVPWNLMASAAIGLWLMFAPAMLGNTDRAADNDHLIGALIITFAVIAMAEVARPARLLNVAFGLWLIVAPWIVAGASPVGRWNDVVAGVVIIALSLRRGAVSERYASWDRFI